MLVSPGGQERTQAEYRALLLDRLAPTRFEVVLGLAFHDADFRWFDPRRTG